MNRAQAGRPEEAMPIAAIVMTLGTYAFFSLLDAGAKWLVTAGNAALFVVWCRFASQSLATFLVWRGWRDASMWRMNAAGLHVLRSVLLPISTIFNFTALMSLQLAQTSAILMATPVIVTALSGPLLGERVGWRRWLSVMAGFIGVLIIIRPGTALFEPAILWSVGSAFSGALYNILTRRLAATESQASLVFFPSILAVVLLAPFALPQAALPATAFDTALLCVFGLFGMAGHSLLISASRIAGAARIAPFAYSQMLWMVLLGLIVFGQFPDHWTLAGSAVIIAAGAYIMHRERVVARRAQPDGTTKEPT